MRSRLSLMAAAAALAGIGYRNTWTVHARGYGYRRQPVPRFRPRREKYPGQSAAYLRGAWRPMTSAEIRDHNRAVDEKKGGA